MPMTEAQRKAKRKYDQKTYTTIACKCKISEADKLKEYAKNNGMSTSMLLYKSVKYIIDNNINLSDPEISP